MKLLTLVSAIALALFASASPTLAAPAAAQPDVVPNQYIVTLKPSANLSAFSRALKTEIARERESTTGGGVVPEFGHEVSIGSTFKAVTGTLTDEMVRKLKANGQVASIEPNFILRMFETTQLDPPSWGLSRISRRNGQGGNYYFPDRQGEGVDVYVLDSGIQVDHSEFAGNRADFVYQTDNSWPSHDIHGHGTHIAGIAAGRQYGVAKRANVRAVKVVNAGDGSSTWTNLVLGMKEAYNAISARGGKTAVCVISLGAEGVTWDGPDRAVRALQDGGCVVVKAGGDVGKDSCNFTPARAPEGLTVAILGRDGQSLAYYSNTGRCVHIAAPGHDIVSANHRGGFTTRSGSSFAAPHVAGAAALILGQEPWLKPTEVVDRVLARASHGVIRGNLKDTPNRVVYVRP